jgi:hypothetical protein
VSRLSAVGAVLWDLVVGDDWRIALGVVVALGVTAIVAGAGAPAWWILPPAVVAVLAASLWRATRP